MISCVCVSVRMNVNTGCSSSTGPSASSFSFFLRRSLKGILSSKFDIQLAERLLNVFFRSCRDTCSLEVEISNAGLLLTDSACCAAAPRAGKKEHLTFQFKALPSR